jgi:spore germination protein Q
MTINYQNPFYQQAYQPFYYPYGAFPQYGPEQNHLYTESSYIENILRLNKGKVATVYMNFESSQWGSKIFRGELLEAGKDHIIIQDSQSKVNYLLLTIYLSYITFDEQIEYNLNFQSN